MVASEAKFPWFPQVFGGKKLEVYDLAVAVVRTSRHSRRCSPGWGPWRSENHRTVYVLCGFYV